MTTGNLYSIKEIDRNWNNEMLAILRASPIETQGLTICFDRAPDIFLGPELKSEYYKFAGFFRKDELVGFAMLLYYEAYVNGKPQLITYFGNMYIKKGSRNRGFYFRASDFLFKNPYKNSSLGYSIIMRGNISAESHINRIHPRFRSIPYSKIIALLDVKNILITFPKKENLEYKIRSARMDDIEQIVELLAEELSRRLFAPVIDCEKFKQNLKNRPDFGISNYYLAEKNGEIVGVCAAWDIKSIRQNRVIQYGGKFKWIKNFYSVLAPILGFPALPKPGAAFKDVVITEYAVKSRNPSIMEALLLKIYNDYRSKQYNMLIFGSCSHDPMLKASRKFFCQSVVSNIVLGVMDKGLIEAGKIDSSLPYIDMASI